jgi:galactose oxidase
VTFSDDNAVLIPELWDPATESFTQLAPMQTPRVYHSVALLLSDGRVFAGGGGQCGDCATNHPDAEIFSPPYLFASDGTLAARPAITDAPSAGTLGQTITVTATENLSSFALIRLSVVTHSTNNDQRRIPLGIQSQPSAGQYVLAIPADPGTVPLGYYMLFAIDANGVPSQGSMILMSS